MKQRVITSILLTVFLLPPVLLGGVLMNCVALIFALIGAYELVKIRNKSFDYVLFVLLVIFLSGMFFYNKDLYLLIMIIFLITLLVLAISNEKYEIQELTLFYVFSLIIAFGVISILQVYSISNYLFLFICFSSFGCDVGAYFFGYFFGKHKLNPRISPKKTIEGAIGGWFAGALSASVYGYFVLSSVLPIGFILLAAVTLPLISQIGDLTFSLLKRHYKIKDFGTIFPGHGGVLDRMDSLLLCLVFFSVLLGVIQ